MGGRVRVCEVEGKGVMWRWRGGCGMRCGHGDMRVRHGDMRDGCGI